MRGAHDVSHHCGAGGNKRAFGMAPRSKTSTRIMGPPQHGHGVGVAGSGDAVLADVVSILKRSWAPAPSAIVDMAQGAGVEERRM